MKKILLIEPNFPYPCKSKKGANYIHKNFVPIGLLKLGAFYKSQGCEVQLIRGEKSKENIGNQPDEILVTSVFTYWSKYVWDNISYYREMFPDSIIRLGGIYSTLHYKQKKFKKLAREFRVKTYQGIHKKAEKYLPDYTLLPKVDYHATHMMRGCIRRCAFCGTWILEPCRTNKSKQEIEKELITIGKNRVIFYDNNILANPHIKEILQLFENLKINKKPVLYEAQSGFDGRLLEKDPELAVLIKKARFQNIRIAWDNGLADQDAIKRQIDLLVMAGYKQNNISIFMIYNFNISYEQMIKKIEFCAKWGVQITDCRYRPLEFDFDNYNSNMRHGQPKGSYYIHDKSGWTDKKIRDFRSKVRKHNIWVRYAKDKGRPYDKNMERWSDIHTTFKFFKMGRPPQLEIITNSPKWKQRIQSMNKIKRYFNVNNKLSQFDFREFNLEKVDKELKTILANLFNSDDNITKKAIQLNNEPR